jgi:hypothetical protein
MKNVPSKVVQALLPELVLNAAARWSEFELRTVSDIIASRVEINFADDEPGYEPEANIPYQLGELKDMPSRRHAVTLRLPEWQVDRLRSLAAAYQVSFSDMLSATIGREVIRHADCAMMECRHVRLPVALIADAKKVAELKKWEFEQALFDMTYFVGKAQFAEELRRVRSHFGPRMGIDLTFHTYLLEFFDEYMADHSATFDETVAAYTWWMVRRQLLIQLYAIEHRISREEASRAVMAENKRPTGYADTDPNL